MTATNTLTSKVTTKYDSIRIVVKQGSHKLSLTYGRNGETCNGTIGLDRMKIAIREFGLLRDRKDAGTMGERIDRLATLADQCSSFDEFIARISQA